MKEIMTSRIIIGDDNIIRKDVKEFISGGIVLLKYSFRNGLIHGKCFHYHNNGVVAQEVDYVDGNKHGIYREFDENRNLIRNSFFQNGRYYFLMT